MAANCSCQGQQHLRDHCTNSTSRRIFILLQNRGGGSPSILMTAPFQYQTWNHKWDCVQELTGSYAGSSVSRLLPWPGNFCTFLLTAGEVLDGEHPRWWLLFREWLPTV
jgi:hypothetical protein